jgi:excisionase family DNA binding protein
MKAEVEGTQGLGGAARTAEAPELFTASEFAHFCGVDLKTIHNWADKGQIRHFRTPGRHLRFRRLDVIDFLRKFGYPVPESLRSGKPKVVVVDADAIVLANIRRGLGRRFEVTTFQDPFEALVAIGTLEPDAMVIDVDMSGLDGVRCLERLKSIESTSHIRTIVYSSEEQRRRAAMDAGAFDFIPKGELTLLREVLERATGLERT